MNTYRGVNGRILLSNIDHTVNIVDANTNTKETLYATLGGRCQRCSQIAVIWRQL